MEKRQKILVLAPSYFGKSTANGVCARNIVDELKKNYDVYVIGYDEENNTASSDISENEIVVPYKKTTMHKDLFHRITGFIKRCFTPVKNRSLVNEYLNSAQKLLKDKDIKKVVAVYFPVETCVAMAELKKFYPELFTVMYELDSVTDGTGEQNWKRTISDLFARRNLIRIYKKIDCVFVMRSHEKHVKKFYGSYIKNLQITDLPVLVKPFTTSLQSDVVKFIYSGLLSSDYRNPQKLLDIIGYIKKSEWKFSFFTRGNCDIILEKTAEKDSRIYCGGYISQAELDREIAESPFLLSIGNKTSESVPSKLIAYISTGKPIIHLCLKKNDVCKKYLEKYPLSLIIEENVSPQKAASAIRSFVEKNIGKTVAFEEIFELFYENTPEHSAEKLMAIGEGK